MTKWERVCFWMHSRPWTMRTAVTHWTLLEVQRFRGATSIPRDHSATPGRCSTCLFSFFFFWEDLLPTFYVYDACESSSLKYQEIMLARAPNFANAHEDSSTWKVFLSIPKTQLSSTKGRMGFLILIGASGRRICKRERHQMKKIQTKAVNLLES